MSELTSAALSEKTLYYVPLSEIQRIRKSISDPFLLAWVLSDVFRINALYMIRSTNSGHIGSSFSSIDIATWLWTQELRNPNESGKDPSDIYFSSKGHDVPALYSILIGLEKLDFEMIHKLRRLGGLPGHPDTGTPYIAANTGSLGMGISKARGMAKAKRLQGKSGRVYVLTGDGELQEGQIWESLQTTVNGKYSEITAIVDHNKIQSDSWVSDLNDVSAIEQRFRDFGWEVLRCDGHDFYALKKAFDRAKTVGDRPQMLIADTIKGKGVSFMERMDADGTYKFHSGAPAYEQYVAAFEEIRDRANSNLKSTGLDVLQFESAMMPATTMPGTVERLIPAYGDELLKIGRERKDVVVLDADLIPDTGVLAFKNEFPDRFVECGIAEQDMVSMAGGIALQGMLPIAHSFAAFVSTRPNEHIYNNATEKKRIIYVGTLAGLLPGMPGHSHQSVRDISALGGIPGLVAIEPANEREARMAIRWAVEKNPESTYIRFVSVASEAPYRLPEKYELEIGKGALLVQGTDVLIMAYGPVMMTEAVKAVELLRGKGISTAVMNFPWLNRVDSAWLSKALNGYPLVVTIDDHYVSLGQGMQIRSALAPHMKGQRILSLGVEEIPACGHNSEVLQYHKLDFESIAERIEKET
ncbi:MAG: Transketolase [Candidatus Kaiserbacteria bacterium GW2011_GWC2_52_8b]|uniref:Transketolase n=1 Tax=Candidatus Kaiserbacteria bacterium GW2011_GWC2_52_8b TaxID=1618676 RepID=A0A0G1XLJ9_9BACT|nr:MAG: Transketolase [Candidatus Kaiserbacteria bacterium GW2011_GWC2_52_8b]